MLRLSSSVSSATSTLLRLRHLPTPSYLSGFRLCSTLEARHERLHPSGYGYCHSLDAKDMEAIKLFERWCKKYRKSYSSQTQKIIRFCVFKEKLKNSTLENHLHVYADLTSDEWKGMNLAKPSTGRLCSAVVESRDPDSVGNFHSEAEARELFEIWCEEYGKTYNSEEEKLYRFGIFKERLEWCTGENQKHSNSKFRCFSTNGYADLTPEEMNELFGFGRRKPLHAYFFGTRYALAYALPSDHATRQLVAEVPIPVDSGTIKHKDDAALSAESCKSRTQVLTLPDSSSETK